MQPFQVRYHRNPYFTGRSQLLQDLHKTLTREGVAALSHAAAIAGLGGIGKTQTAIEYAYRYFYDTPTYDWVFWVTADTELNLVSDLAKIGESLHLGVGESNVEEVAQQTYRWLETNPRWLLIFDNADQPELVKPWLPHNPQGRVLLTSRAQGFVKLGITAPIAMPALSLEESLRFLVERTDRSIPASPVATKTDDPEFIAATALARELAGLPLALEQAAAYIRQVGVSFAVYWKYYQQQRLVLLEKRKPETGDYPQSVATTWSLNFEALEKRSPASVPILQLSAVLAADNIPEFLLLKGAVEFGLTEKPSCFKALVNKLFGRQQNSQFDQLKLELAESLSVLADFSLIQREWETASYSIHRMVQAVVWQRLIPAAQQDWMQRAIAGLNAAFPDVEFVNWHLCGQLVPHVQAIATRLESTTTETLDWALLLSRAGYYLHEQGRYGEAEPLYVRSLQIREQQLGADHPDTATSLNNLASLYESQGRYAEAEPLYVRSLQIKEQQLGADHPSTATSLNNLAWLYKSQGRYTEAEPLYMRSLHITEQQLGADHPDTATSLNNLALLYYSQGRYAEAEPLYVRSLHITEQQLGADHPDTATSLNNLALLYKFQGRYAEAEPLYMRSLQIREQQLGADHPSTATSLNNLASLYESQGRYTEAEPLYVRSLQIREQQLGADHPDTATSLNNLASLYESQGRYAEAEPLYVRTLAIFINVLGENHPNTQTVWGNFCYLVQQAVEAGRAGELSDHPTTQAVLQQVRGQ